MKLSIHLPEELLDEIFSHLRPDDRQSLRSCSLVSKSWLEPSRRLIFSSILIHFHTYQSWLSTISPTNTGVLRHVRSLEYFHHHQKPSDPRRGVYSLRDYLPSFSHLHTLTFRNFDVEETIPDHLEIFSAFQHTLSSLSLVHVSITWSTFVALLGYFPRLRHLEVRRVLFRVDDRPAPQMNHALRGRMVIDQLDNEGLKPFIDWFSGLRAEYEELVMLGPCEHRMVAAVGANLRFLEINLSGGGTTPDLSRFPELRLLKIVTLDPQEDEHFLVSSITSANFQKLVVVLPPTFRWGPPRDTCLWPLFEEAVCGLSDRLRVLGARHILEVRFHARLGWGYSQKYRRAFLPKFQEKGEVRIVSC
ncbi:hypothetical protein BJ322DRAFT_1076994 [Thelephora terrestris]|uniref:F-box domain-containing protein n=1 Tax=Thelephora terrestris TaxID=56493 RepID=A0A9P6HB55_9AGAM|nr:hypothetical protein BJ322DRAFT_1076994 [Thelephora terrestris]